ncbi:NAD-dependent protein deacetylase sirtuin-7 [Trichogramma pretiosum]|uniref:NAD-dependent protein deacetylase sirtuin-7 n=1 Tax=Trichogramma pretiosum TaxID=7493 RepID=UPI0006C96C80|nr:NAD-dependent protein deacetylase sirtuin-7 [Trichogramma pretiosum]
MLSDSENIKQPEEKKPLARRRCTIVPLKVQDERIATTKKVNAILHKPEDARTPEECEILESCSDIVKQITKRQEKRIKVKARTEEVEDPPEVLEEKCIRLAAAISNAKSLIVYTGAGISTAASIPDYRGTNGVWTRLQQGKDIGNHDLSQAEPTLTHMSLYALYKSRILKYVVSQNCDGLHLRSGIPKTSLSEVHGNMFVEVCRNCKPAREYLRLFDVTEKTARYAHATGRKCYKCNSNLQDSIVHFGERGNLLYPINWGGASRASKQADVILCLGSSLKVLKKYTWLWQMDKPAAKRAQLYIVNLQWTPKDETATLKINGKCDKVMKIVMSHLGIDIPNYDRNKDPIFHHAIRLHSSELTTTSQPVLEAPMMIDEQKEELKDENQEVANETDESIQDEHVSSDVEVIQSISSSEHNKEEVVSPINEQNISTEELNAKNEEVNNQENCELPVIMLQEPVSGYSAPYFTALPFISMGLPFPPMFIYPQLSPLIYYQPFVHFPTQSLEINKNESENEVETDQVTEIKQEIYQPEPEAACSFCMEHEGSLTCLYYQQYDDDSPINQPSQLDDLDKSEKMINEDENTPSPAAVKNPGWFGKGYRKGMKRKR